MNYEDLQPKILITGTGRCGTSFLHSIFWKLGYEVQEHETCRIQETHLPEDGILEEPALWNQRPHVMKSPISATKLATAIWAGEWKYYQNALEHVFIPIRDPEMVVDSHERKGWPIAAASPAIRDLLPKTDQCSWLVGNLISALTYACIPFTTLNFPYMAKESSYLYMELRRSVLKPSHGVKFRDVWEEVNHYEEAKGRHLPDYERMFW